jgi:hypothetical protein
MPRTKGSKNKNTNTAKNKNVININVNSSTSKKGRGRPRKQSNNTAQNRHPLGYNPNSSMMAPPQVIISQPTPQQDNSLLTSYLTAKLMNESNAPARSSTIEPADVAPPRIMERVEAPITTPPIKAPVVKPADIAPSTIIKTKEPIPITTPPKTVIKPSEVAPNTDLAIRENSIDYTDDEIKRNEIKQLRNLQKKKDRTESENDLFNTLKTKYTGVKTKTPKVITEEMMNASDKLKSAVKAKLYSKEIKDYVKEVKEKRAVNKIESAMESKKYSDKLKQVLAVRSKLEPSIKQALTRGVYIKKRDKYYDKKEKNKLDTLEAQIGYIENVVRKADETNKQKAATKIQSAIRNRKAINTFADMHVERIKQKTEAGEAALKKIQAAYRGNKTRQTLNNTIDFQDKIDKKIKKYSNLASEYNTRGRFDQDINEELRDHLKMNKKGLQNYKKTLGNIPVKPGPKGPRNVRPQNEF